MYITAEHGIDLQLGSGLYRFRFVFHRHEGVLLRVPFLGKFWVYGPELSGCNSWAELKQEDPALGD